MTDNNDNNKRNYSPRPSVYFLFLMASCLTLIPQLTIAGTFKCPPSDMVAPCKCFTWDEKVSTSTSDETTDAPLDTEVEISCRTLETTEMSLESLFTRLNSYAQDEEFISSFTSLRLENTAIRNLTKPDLFGNITFVNVDIFFNNDLRQIDLTILSKSRLRLETLLIQGSALNASIIGDVTKFPLLTTLILTNNHLPDLPDKAFGMTAQSELSYLDLTYNNITRLNNKTFYQLSSLQRVSLDHNSISVIETEAFDFINANESQLLLIFLRHNNLTSDSFSSDSFISSERTIFLYLNNNRITHLPESVFKPILNQKNDLFVALWSNPFECDCRSKWLLTDVSYYKKRLHGIRCRDKRELWDLNVSELESNGKC